MTLGRGLSSKANASNKEHCWRDQLRALRDRFDQENP
jgi:hypothetical protein